MQSLDTLQHLVVNFCIKLIEFFHSIVDKAKQERQQKIVQAEGEAAAASMLGESLGKNPGYLKLRKLRASQHIAKTVSTNSKKNYSALIYILCKIQ